MLALAKGSYRARLAETEADLARVQELRWRAFRAARRPGGAGGGDADAFDPVCRHFLVEERRAGRLVAGFRLLPLAGGREIGRSYAAQHYGLSRLASYPDRMVELGRFCVDPECHDADVLRIAWGAVTRFVDGMGAGMLFGCSSFPGTDAESYRDTFALLAEHHLSPRQWRPRVKAAKVFRYAARLENRDGDPARTMKPMPPLLRAYLSMGAWVSDHAVVDDDLGTLHVFTGLEVAAIPPGRARSLRHLAG